MKPPKLYRKVYVIANECNPDDVDYHVGKVYIRANLALDELNEPFWQIMKSENNILDYEYSDLDIYCLDYQWSNKDHPERLLFKFVNKHNPDKSFNRKTISHQYLDEIPF